MSGNDIRRSTLSLALAWVVCVTAGCGTTHTDGTLTSLRLRGGHVLRAWRATDDRGIYLYVPGFDDVDYAKGVTVTALNPRSHALRRDVYLSSGKLSAHLKLTYGYSTRQIAAAFVHGRKTTTPAWVTHARQSTRDPKEVQVDRHLGADLNRLRTILGTKPPCLGDAVAGLPLAGTGILSDRESRTDTRGIVVCVYSTNLADPARAGRFVTVTGYRAGTAAANADLAHSNPKAVISTGHARAYRSRGDLTDLVIAVPDWVVVVSSNQNVPTIAGWRPYLTALVHALA